MKQIYFCNKKSLQIISPNIKNDIKKLINDIGVFNLTSKYYTFLNKKNVNNLKENQFLVSLSTFGKKFILFITNYNTKKYCIFINKKNDTMIVTQLKFIDDIFLGTLLDGELVKNSNDKWIFLINDCAYYKGKNIVTMPFNERQAIIENILENEHDNELQNEDNCFYISKKMYFNYENLKDLVDNYMPRLNYKSSGIYFKNINNFSDNYLFIFPECRSDSKILNNGTTIDNQKVFVNNVNNGNNMNSSTNNYGNNFSKNNKNGKSNLGDDMNDDDSDLFKDTEIINMNDNVAPSPTINKKLEKTTCRFLIHETSMPDIYELYCKNKNNIIEKYNYASVPDIETSDLLKNIMGDDYDINEDIHTKVEKNKAIYVECNYHKTFKKWIPYKRVDSMDNIMTINQIQIILDSL